MILGNIKNYKIYVKQLLVMLVKYGIIKRNMIKPGNHRLVSYVLKLEMCITINLKLLGN